MGELVHEGVPVSCNHILLSSVVNGKMTSDLEVATSFVIGC